MSANFSIRYLYMPLFSNNFSKAFSRILELSGVSCYELARCTDINESYLSRLRSGEKQNPSPEVIMRICIAIALNSKNNRIRLRDFEDLFNSVGRSLYTGKRS